MRRGSGPTPTIGAVLVLLALVVVGAATAPPWDLEERRLWSWVASLQFDRPGFEFEAEWEDREGDDDASSSDLEPLDLRWLGVVVRGLLAVAVLTLLWWLWRRFRFSEIGARVRTEDGIVAAGDAAEPELPVLRQGVAAARTLLAGHPDPTDAIIAAWLAVEAAAADAGVTRRLAQTPTEFTVAVLERTQADPDAARRLLRLYLRARFSGQPATAADVAEAEHHLAALAASWDTVAAAEGERP